MKVLVSGGALLPNYLESFFALTGIPVRVDIDSFVLTTRRVLGLFCAYELQIGSVLLQLLAGYGLTETSPVVCNQLAEHKVQGSIGLLAPHTQVKIVDPETGAEVPEGTVGVLRGTVLRSSVG